MAVKDIAIAGEAPRSGAFQRFLRRRRFIVDRSLQLQLLAVSLGQILFFGAVLASGLFLPLVVQLLSGPIDAPATERAAAYFLKLHSTFWAASVLALAAVLLHALQVSHRLAGPLYRLRLAIDALAEGRRPRPIHLRHGDYLQSEIEHLNRLIERSGQRGQERAELRHALNQCLDRLQALRPRIEHPEAGDAIEQLLAHRAQIDYLLADLKAEE